MQNRKITSVATLLITILALGQSSWAQVSGGLPAAELELIQLAPDAVGIFVYGPPSAAFTLFAELGPDSGGMQPVLTGALDAFGAWMLPVSLGPHLDLPSFAIQARVNLPGGMMVWTRGFFGFCRWAPLLGMNLQGWIDSEKDAQGRTRVSVGYNGLPAGGEVILEERQNGGAINQVWTSQTPVGGFGNVVPGIGRLQVRVKSPGKQDQIYILPVMHRDHPK